MSTFYNDLAGAPKFTLLPCLLLFLWVVKFLRESRGTKLPIILAKKST
jgi:hypothetical protein